MKNWFVSYLKIIKVFQTSKMINLTGRLGFACSSVCCTADWTFSIQICSVRNNQDGQHCEYADWYGEDYIA